MPSVALPMRERFTVEYVTGKSWSGYNWYQGGFKSLIQVNTDLPIYIDRAVDLACHEGYPGHHAYNVLLEKNLVEDRGWIEYTVYPLFSPAVADRRRHRQLRHRGGVCPRRSARGSKVTCCFRSPDSTRRRWPSIIRCSRWSIACPTPATRRRGSILDGKIDRAAAVAWLEKYALYTGPRAEQRVKFIEQYRSYVINYNLGKDLVRAYVDRQMGRDRTRQRRWTEFMALLSSPRLPSGLK